MAEHADSADGTLTDSAGHGAADGAQADDVSNDEPRGTSPRRRGRRAAAAAGLVVTVAVAALAGWQGFRLYQTRSVNSQRAQYIQVARQAAINLTTIDFEHADRDIQRVVDLAAGEFRDDFAKRSPAFVEVVKKAHSKSEGTITEAALESQSHDIAQVLVVVRVAVTNSGAPEQEPRRWRMRMSVQNVGQEMKISQVAFVP